MEDKKPPILTQKYAITGTRIVVIFSAVFIFMKLFAIVGKDLWLIPNLLICIPALVLGVVGINLLKSRKTHISFVIFALLVFVLVRIYEEQLQLYFYQMLQS